MNIFNSEKQNKFLLKSGAKHKDHFSVLLFSITLEVQGSAIKQEKEMKGTHTGKEELTLFFFFGHATWPVGS